MSNISGIQRKEERLSLLFIQLAPSMPQQPHEALSLNPLACGTIQLHKSQREIISCYSHRQSKAVQANLDQCTQKRYDVTVLQFAKQRTEQKTLQTHCALATLQAKERKQ